MGSKSNTAAGSGVQAKKQTEETVEVNVEEIIRNIRSQLNGNAGTAEGVSAAVNVKMPNPSTAAQIKRAEAFVMFPAPKSAPGKAVPPEKIDIEAIMDEIRREAHRGEQTEYLRKIAQEIQAEADRQPMESLPDFSAAESTPPAASAGSGPSFLQLSNEANYLKSSYTMPFYWEMGKGLKGFVKRVFRRLSKFMLFPILQRQTEYNLHTANGIEAIRIALENQIHQIDALNSSAAEAARLLAIHGEELVVFKQGVSAHGDQIKSNKRELADHGYAIAMHGDNLETLNEDLSLCRDELARQMLTESSQKEQLEAFKASVENVKSDLADHENEIAMYRARIKERDARLEALEANLACQGDELASQRIELQRHTEKLAGQEECFDAVNRAIDEISLSIGRTIRHYMASDSPAERSVPLRQNTDAAVGENSAAEESGNAYKAVDYFKLQNDFRGTQDQIMERQRGYLPYFRGKSGRILNLGCGQGEFLRLLKEENIPAFGVDTSSGYKAAGRLNGIDICDGDGLEALERQKEPLGGIFCAQVIERLCFKAVEKLCRLAFDKLEQGGYLIVETPNPMCVSTLTNGFYIDPTHEKPIHPLLMEYLLKSIGFSDVQLVFPDHSLPALPAIRSGSIDNLEEVNQAIERVSNLLFGSQDYAVIAKR